MRSRLSISLIAVVALLVAACSSKGDVATPKVAVSIPPQKYLLQQIVGDKMEVVTLLQPGSNPETYEPTVATIRDLSRAKAYFTVGTLPFESNIKAQLGDRSRIIDTSAGLDLLYGTHEGCDHHHHHDGDHDGEAPDPHTWSSVRNARVMAATMAQAISSIDPDNADYYADNLARLNFRLDSMDRAIAAKVASLGSRSFVIWHPSLSYLARDYGLTQITLGSEGKESAVNQLRERIDHAGAHDANVFFFQREFDTRQAQSVKAQLGIEMVTINPMNEDWESEINHVIDALR